MRERRSVIFYFLATLLLHGCAGWPSFDQVSGRDVGLRTAAEHTTNPANPIVAPVAPAATTGEKLAAMERARLVQAVIGAYSHVPQEPILRIETQAHLRSIHALAVSPRGRLLATASVDRTVRLWNSADGTPAGILRPPSGRRGAGTPHALAFTPDGKLLAVAGLSFFSRPVTDLARATFLIHFFDPQQQVVVRTLEDVPGRVHHLAYSRNGRFLAVAYGADNVPELGPERIAGTSGVRIYDAGNLALLRELATESPCQWVEFDSAQRLYAVCQRAVMRFDNNQLTRLRVPEAGNLHHGALSPDGRRLAVSYQGAARVEVLDGDDLSLLHKPALEEPGRAADSLGNLALAWSPGGNFLYAGGQRLSLQQASTENFLLRWPADGAAPPLKIAAGTLDILAMISAEGRILFGTSEATVAAADNAGRIARLVGNATVDAENRPGKLWVSADGKRVAYGEDAAGEQRYVFSLERRTLLPWSEAKQSGELPAALMTGQPEVANWRLSRQPLCGGKRVELNGTVSQNFALDPAGRGFAVGTDSGVDYFDKDCRRRWTTPNQARTIAVAIAPVGGLVISQDEAGVIRWMRLADGEKLLSFFPAKAGHAWAAWTPLGYYDASPEGEALVGWQISRDRHREALFYGAGRFRDLFHRPEEITRSLDNTSPAGQDDDLGRALQLGRALLDRLPPRIRLLAAQERMTRDGAVAQLSFAVRIPAGEPVARVRALVNGRPAGNAVTVALGETEEANGQMLVPLPEGEVEVALIAEGQGVAGEPVRARFHEQLAGAGATEQALRPKLYALLVGVGKYQNGRIPTLDFPGKDASDFAAALRARTGELYRSVEVRTLTEEKATRENVLDGMDWLRRQVTSQDVALVFLAGHGVNDNVGQYYFLPSNADPARLRSTAISNADIVDTLQSLPSKVIAFLDTCHSGNVLGTGKKRALGDINRLVNELTSAENGVIVFASSTGQEMSVEDSAWGNGAFTKALVEGLGGSADFNRDGVISLNELNLWVSERVKHLSEGEQHANMIRPDSIRDFPLVLLRKP